MVDIRDIFHVLIKVDFFLELIRPTLACEENINENFKRFNIVWLSKHFIKYWS